MPPHQWKTQVVAAVRPLGSRDPEAAALAASAAWSVDELHYLRELDASRQGHGMGHGRDVVDRAHARWAAAGAITALDLCAAALGRHYSLKKSFKEVDLEQLQRKDGSIPAPAQAWVRDALCDNDYGIVLSARHSLTHRRLPRNLYLGPARPTELRVDYAGHEICVRIPDLIQKACDVATRFVERFLAEAGAGQFP